MKHIAFAFLILATPLTAQDADPLPFGVRDQLKLSDKDHAACLVKLTGMGVTFTPAEPIIPTDDRDCGILRPLTISKIAPDVALSPPATLRCTTALALAAWTRDVVLPATTRMTDRGALTVIENGSGYVCRRRNNLSDGKLSEHAFGNAFDVMGFNLLTAPQSP